MRHSVIQLFRYSPIANYQLLVTEHQSPVTSHSSLITHYSSLITDHSSLRILIVCSENSRKIAPFILEQAEALNKLGVETDFFTIKSRGWKGYLRNRKSLIKKITDYRPDLIHAHYGLSGLLANLQRKVLVVTTYHGSDINHDAVYRFSKWSIHLSAYNIFVSKKNYDKANVKSGSAIVPCGVDTELFKPKDKSVARKKLGFTDNEKMVLFAGAFDNPVKNPELAQSVVAALPDVRLMELKNYSREQVALLMNAVDACLMTSHSEGSPQFIKEAMACNCPVVSVDVGDVREMIQNTAHCYVSGYDAQQIADKLNEIFEKGERTNGRNEIIVRKLDQISVANQILNIYKSVLKLE